MRLLLEASSLVGTDLEVHLLIIRAGLRESTVAPAMGSVREITIFPGEDRLRLFRDEHLLGAQMPANLGWLHKSSTKAGGLTGPAIMSCRGCRKWKQWIEDQDDDEDGSISKSNPVVSKCCIVITRLL